MTDFGHLASGGKDAIIAGLDIRAVSGALGHALIGTELHLCMLHPRGSGTASLNVFTGDDGKQRFYCHTCGVRGDVIDFVGKLEDIGYADALARCQEFLDQGLPAPQAAANPTTPADLRKVLDDARANSNDPIGDFLAERGSPIAAQWLIERFRLGVNQRGEIIIPHYGAGEESPRAIKRRSGADKAAYSGSRLTELYGAWLDSRAQRVVICEGESDTWTVSWLLRDSRCDVLGLPRGVGSNVEPAWLDALRGRSVFLLFDSDDAGRAGLRRWVTALRGVAEETRLVLLPETADASSLEPTEVLDALTRAQPAPNFPDLPVFRTPGGYFARAGKGEDAKTTPLTDWVLTVLGRTEIEGESIHYTVRLPNGVVDRLSNADLRNADVFSRWANRWGLTHAAGGFAVQHLLRLLEAESVYVPRRRGVTVAGWHDGRFVLPGRTLGRQDVEYVPGPLDARLENRVSFTEPGPAGVSRASVVKLARLHEPSVMTPILGWIAAAPLRALCAQFPTLAVMGSSGSGKTTIIEAVLRTFGMMGKEPTNVSNQTWHAVWTLAASSNGLPAWFDEYRAGGRADGVAALEQVIRDAWNGAATLRGGVGENKSALFSMVATAPLLVSGEGAFQEQSHAERSVYVALSRSGRNATALAEWRQADVRGLGLDYLRWLVHQGPDRIPAPPSLTDRPAQAIATARWGYGILLEWLEINNLADRMPAWDETLVQAQQSALLAANPYLEALRECADAVDGTGDPLVYVEGRDLIVRYGRIPTYVRQKTTIVLPGGERALLAWLEESFEIIREPGRYVRVINGAACLSVS